MRVEIIFLFFLVGSLAQTYGSNRGPNLGGNGNECCDHYQIQVSGEGVSSGLPDLAVIRVRFQETAKTSREAVKALAAHVNQLILILSAVSFQPEYSTSSINVYNEYAFINGRNEVVGKTASQSITVNIKSLDPKGEKVGNLIDQIATIDGALIDSVTFDIEDKTKLQEEARNRAYQDAEQKAQDYAEFALVKVGRALIISDEVRVQAAPQPLAKSASLVAADFAGTEVPLGQQDVSYRLLVTFALSN